AIWEPIKPAPPVTNIFWLISLSSQQSPSIIKCYQTAMRQGEILNLTWALVELKEGFIQLRPEDSKTIEGVARRLWL
ncbi:MAG: hypothetical protein WCB64_00715, partial [Desulfobaccales bacterium]